MKKKRVSPRIPPSQKRFTLRDVVWFDICYGFQQMRERMREKGIMRKMKKKGHLIKFEGEKPEGMEELSMFDGLYPTNGEPPGKQSR